MEWNLPSFWAPNEAELLSEMQRNASSKAMSVQFPLHEHLAVVTKLPTLASLAFVWQSSAKWQMPCV